ncbi:metal-dependent hydrolase [Halapricum desulfuricans]|uniref:Membrane assocaited metal-dependent hydrolase n=1 Tax=Halapricum desulfuricans TaxID=2841257 RepID=A0A897NGQ2_9EURY|nr:metal-dependent hydrolase [Halapricum desulfuricans]QSG10143.1 Membrane assocaited metal-dependent hydrolase [Halapricum desulfuricans]QSG10764.1 Membrane assocaited metal-dependent hydrolase [Halapricum desulfuricans]
MVSTVVHAALAGLIAAALLRGAFGVRSLAVVVSAVIVVDLDVFIGLWVVGAHRAAFHTLLFPFLLAGLLGYETRLRDRSWLRDRFGTRGVRTGWVAIVAVVFAGIGPDLFTNGVNLLYPLHDQFYQLTGHVRLSTEEGLVQTFVDLSPSESPAGSSGGSGQVAVGSTGEVGDRYWTGVDPQPSESGTESGGVERVFPIVGSGEQLLLVLTSAFVVGSRLLEERRD